MFPNSQNNPEKCIVTSKNAWTVEKTHLIVDKYVKEMSLTIHLTMHICEITDQLYSGESIITYLCLK